MRFYLGVDLGGTNIKTAVCDENGHILSKAESKTPLPYHPEAIALSISDLCIKALESSHVKRSDIKSVGIGVPGTANRDAGIIDFASNLGFHFVPLALLVEKHLGINVLLENDANAAALGEFAAGGGQRDK